MTEQQDTVGSEEIQRRVKERLKAYEDKSILESFGLYMGNAQILELGLKGLLVRKCGYSDDDENFQRLTMGQTKDKLIEHNFRPDFTEHLKSVVKWRNKMAHEFLSNFSVTNQFMLQTIGKTFSEHRTFRDLFNAAYVLENSILFFDWINERDDWGDVQP
ncbi:hypothetical protein ACJ8J6_05155 [Serratia sp. CY47279]|uniref:hypothetical protein n=1 Tax=Serratia sp. CY47279 TaxID=3383624 RepID=UPI003FA03102